MRSAIERPRRRGSPGTGCALRDGLDGQREMLEVHWLGQVHVSARADALLEHFGLHTPRNHFKRVNDTHGHLVGDRVIQALGEIMRTSVTNPLHAIARYGGEEFAILAPQTSLEQSIQVA